MDIVTHAMAGTILASPFFTAAPLTASCFILGSAIPDMDALSRLFGKTAFLRWHQTYTHSLPVIGALTILTWIFVTWHNVHEVWMPLALGAGMLMHVMLDVTNTYGVALKAPLSRKRYCMETVFFIDGIVVATSALCLVVALLHLYQSDYTCLWVAIAYGTFILGYWLLRWLLRRRAFRMATRGTQSLIPSATIPWRFFGYAVNEDIVDLFELNAISGTTRKLTRQPTYDSKYRELLNSIVEYRLMRELSQGYFTVEATEDQGKTLLTCRDLRTRNFGGAFGQLEIRCDSAGNVERKVLNV